MITADLTPHRHPDESRAFYVERRRAGNQQIAEHLQGRVFWPAYNGTFNEGRNALKRKKRALAKKWRAGRSIGR